MSSSYIMRKKKYFSLFMIFLMLISLFMPGLADAQMSEDVTNLTVEQEKQLEKEREQNVQHNLEGYNSEVSENGIPSLLDGINLSSEPEYDEDDFVIEGKVEKDIIKELDSEGKVNVIIRLTDAVDMAELSTEVSSIDNRADRAKAVVDKLKSISLASQNKLMQQLQEFESNKMVSDIQTLWVINGLSATINKEALEVIAQREDVKRITLDREINVPEIQVEDTPPRLPEWGLEKIFAPKVWGEYKLQGEGIVVGIMDTGVSGNHDALSHNYRGRDGNHQYSWIDLSGHGYTTPNDGHGHGTHVAGSAVGGGAGEPIGVAPGAEWIAAKIFNDSGGTTASAIHQAFEWFLAPGGDATKAPHVVNNSWGSADTYRTEFLEGVRAWVAAGIFPLFSAGNEGPGAQTVGSPGSFPESFAIGASDVNDQIASFSSRGPVSWPDENGELVRYVKPEVTAPGHQIYSAWPDGGYNTISGTSMAAPHVTGAIALILQSQPDLTIDEVADLLERTARTESHMGALPNDNYGHGIVNVYQAVTEAAFAGEVKGTLKDTAGNPISGEIFLPKEELRVEVKEDGQFSFKVREGKHEVVVSSFGFHSITETMDVTKGSVVEKAWALETAARFNIEGTVKNTEGSPVPYAYVRVVDTPLQTVRTDAEGKFFIESVPQDKYTIVVNGKGIKQTSQTINVDKNTTVNFVVEATSVTALEDWATSKNNYSRNAVTNAEVDAENLEETWFYESSGQLLFNSPVIAEGKVIFTTDRGYVVAVDQRTGEEVWSIRTGGTNRSTPTVVDGIVYVAGGADSKIYAIHLESGMTKWTASVEFPAIYETPIYHDGVIYISSYMEENAKAVALDAETGAKLWESAIGDGSFFGAAMGEGFLYVGTYDSKSLSALSLADGSEKWKITLEDQGFASSPVYVDGVVYAVSTNFNKGTGTLNAFDVATGNLLWSAADIGDTQAGSPIVYDDLIIIGSSAKPVIKAFNKTNGELVWQAQNGSTMVNSGAVSGNGYLFVADLASNLQVYDVYTGEKLHTYSLKNVSTTGVAVTDGQVVVGDHSGVTSFEAPGKLTGTITNTDGQPVQAKLTIMETGVSVEADENGAYTLHASPGTYNVKVAYYGLKQKVEEITFVSGYNTIKNFELEAAALGSVSVEVKDKRTKQALENVSITILDTPHEGSSGNDGKFNFSEVYEGSYAVKFSFAGYVDEVIEVKVKAGENTAVSYEMTPVDVAVLDDYNGEITRFLNNNGIPAEQRGWDIVDEIGSYQVLYMNGAYTSMGEKPSEEAFEELVAAADEHGVSVVFADTWGISYGSLRHLWEFRNDPAQYDSDYNPATIRLRVNETHPILEGLDVNTNYDLHHNGDFVWFNQYSGRNLASVGSTRLGFVGAGVAYKGVTEDSAHLLLSTGAASPWVSPFNGWLPTQQQIMLNGVRYVMDAEFGEVSGSVVDENGNPLDVTVEVVDTGVHVPSSGGAYKLFHDEGSFEVAYRKAGYETKTATVEFKNGEPIVNNIVMGVSNSGTVSGQVTNKITGQAIPYVEINLYDEQGNLVAEEVSSINGAYDIAGLDEATYRLEIILRDYVTYKQTIEVASEPIQLNIELYPSPDVGVIGDSSFGSLRELLEGHGIEATDYSNISSILPELQNLDVVFFNDQSTTSVTLEVLEEFLAEADKHEVSVIFGDTYWSGSGLNHLVNRFQDPESRTTHRDRNSSAGYVVLEKNPIFGDLEPGDFVDILLPNRSDIAYFEGYSGYPIANIKHEAHEEAHGSGIAYKPRTGTSMELLMSGHGISFTHDNRHYTESGKQIFVNAILWAAYIEYNTIEGYITDEEGNPLYAHVQVEGEGLSSWTDPETGYFSIAALDGDYDLEINSFAYQTAAKSVTVNEDLEQFTVKMALQESIGSIEGKFFDENTLEGIQGVHIEVKDHPREATTNVSGNFTMEHFVPGIYSLVVKKEGYVQQEMEVEVKADEATVLNRKMKPSPKIGVIVDGQLSSVVNLKDYLTPRGYIVEDLYYTDLDRISDYDLIFANSDYNNSLNPEKQVFLDFVKELDKTETSVIWTGNGGPRGSIRFLVDYVGDPAIERAGSLSSSQNVLTVDILEDHPLFEGVKRDENGQFSFAGRYYYGFDGYTGKTIATVSHPGQGELGSFAAYGGRTLNSVEVLLSNMTIGYGFTESTYFDESRERILNNALVWALDNTEPLVGEIHGQINNNFDRGVSSVITVEETGYTFKTEPDGSFFLALDTGTYTLNVEAFGHEDKSFEINVVRGESKEETYVITSENAGLIKGHVKAEDTNAGIKGALIRLEGTPLQTTTDENGYYELQAPAGVTYQARVTANGYTPQVVPVQVEKDEEVTLNFTLGISQKIAVVGTSTNNGRLVPFLEQQGYEAIAWLNGDVDQLMEELEEYVLVILNDRNSSAMPEGKFKDFLDLADSYGVSTIFTSQFAGGTIRDLSSFYGDPESVTQGFSPGHINYTVVEDHPIFAGYEVGDVIRIADNGESNQQWSYFTEYSGTKLADLTHDEKGTLGDGVAYKFSTANSVHVLLGSLHAGSYGHPNSRWTEDAKRIFVNAVDWAMSASLGEIVGTVQDQEGEPIAGATVSIESEGLTTQTNAEGQYRIGIGTGSYEVKARAHGYSTQTVTVDVEELGQAVELNFEMEKTDRMSLSGNITDLDGKGIKGAMVTLKEKEGLYEESVETDDTGSYVFEELIAGEYEIEVKVNGYQTITQAVSIEDGASVELDFKLSDFNVAVLGDVKTSLTDFLNENGFAAQSRNWDIVDDVYNYSVIIVNEKDATEEQINKLIEESDKYETSLVFTDTWGVDGSIQLLEKVFGSPTVAEHGYNEGAIHVEALQEHGIFSGLDGETIKIHSEKSPYATFENYEGVTLASLKVDGEDKGATIAYDFRSENHMHLLLSTYAVNNMISPTQGWTQQGKQLYLQAIEWARDGVQELPEAPIADEEEIISTDGNVKITGKAEYRSTVTLLNGEEVLATASPEKDGTFSIEVSGLEDNEYELNLVAHNFAGEVISDTKVMVIVDREAPQLNVTSPVNNMVTGKEVVDVNGSATDANLDEVLVNGEKVEVNDAGEFSTRIILEEGTHTITVEAKDLAGKVTKVERQVTVDLSTPEMTDLSPSADLYVKTGDKVDISFRSESEGGTATYSIKLPAQFTTQTTGNMMEEVEPGVYKGTWTVPANVDLQGAVIEVEFMDVAGNRVVQETAGKLFISKESISRISGATRSLTAIEISKNGWTSADTVVLARLDNYADALAGAPLAYKLGAPILLTKTAKLSDGVLDEIQRLGATKVVVLGGAKAINDGVVDALKEEGLKVSRISGSDRYETASLIANHVAPKGTTKAVVANGRNFPDALSVASYAAMQGLPILLTKPDELPTSTNKALKALGVTNSMVIGGTAVVNEKVMDKIPGSIRVSGKDRYETNIAVAKAFNMVSQNMYVATGRNFADALTGSVLAAKNNSGILLVGNNVSTALSQYLKENNVNRLTIFGGEKALSEEVAAELEKIIK